MILAYIFTLGTLLGFDSGCVQNPYSASCGVPSCLSKSQREEVEKFCRSHGCGACTETTLSDTCYEEFGYCEKQGNTCDWKKTPQLIACVKKADELDEACLVKHGGSNCHKDKNGIYISCNIGHEYSKCLKEEKKKLFK